MPRPLRTLAALSATSAWCGTSAAAEPLPWAIGFQRGASPTMEQITTLSTLVNGVIVLIVVLVTGLVAYVAWRFNATRNPQPANWTHNTKLEIAWTAVPAVILLVVALPSFRLLYFMDRVQEADMTIKVVGHQWYWSYEYPERDLAFDALMVADDELEPGQRRLLTTDRAVVLPVGVSIRIQMTADDVIHSWAVPALGIKTDTVPGRLNETWVRITEAGTYYGQCSELCGVNHAFMPIMIEAVPRERFEAWVEETRTRLAAAPPSPRWGGDEGRVTSAKAP